MLLAFLPFVAMSCKKDKTEETAPSITIFDANGASVSSLAIGNAANSFNVRVISTGDWNLSSDASWLTASPASGHSGAAQITITAAENSIGNSRSAILAISSGTLKKTLTVTQSGVQTTPVPKAGLLDVQFLNNGTAVDVSGQNIPVAELSGPAMVNYYNDLYGMYVAHFSHSLGESTSSSYFKADYSSDSKMLSGLADGHSLECLFRIDEKSDGSKELKMFSSMNSGGTGFLISTASRGAQLTFLPNVSTTGSSNWIWCGSGISPEAGRYYHVVGVWNKTEGKAYIYVDGVLKNTINATGSFIPPSGAACNWFGIGVDAGTSGGDNAWKGDVAIARVYDEPLTAEEVKALYSKVKKEQTGELVSISDLSFLSPCQVAKDYKYYIYGTGFKSGDVIRLESLSDASLKMDCTTSVENGYVKVTVPASLVTGNYRMMLVRGSSTAPLGTTSMTMVSTAPVNIGNTKAVAHRGYHTTGSAENSVGALAKAQALGVYAAETDVWITTDGVVMINHNASYPTDQNNRRIDSSTYDQLKDIKLSDGESAPRLIDFLEQLKKDKMKLVIEIKTQGTRDKNNRCIDSTMALVSRYGLENQVMYIAFDYTNCLRILAADSNADVEYLSGDKTPSELKADGLKGIDYQYSVLAGNPALITDAQSIGIDINVWTVDDQATMLTYISKGVTYITTNNPDVLQGLVSKTFVSKD